MLRDTRLEQLRRRRFERILIIKPSSLGDIIHALPVLNGLRTRYPDAYISWLVATPFASMIENHPQLNEVILFDRKRLGRLGRSLSPTMQFVQLLRELRAQAFDLVIDLQGLFRSGFFARACGTGVRIGFAEAREFAWMFYTHRISIGDADQHAVDKNYRVAEMLGFGHVPIAFDLGLNSDDRRTASELLAGHGFDDGRDFAAVWPGTRWETKRWSSQRFAEVIELLWREHRLPSVLMGDPTETALCDEIARATQSRPVVLAGQTTIRQAAAVLEQAAAVLTHDSAPMHIAAALGRPLVSILGPTNRHRTGPYGMPRSVVQADLPCVPCYLKQLAQCPYHHQCMRDVGVDAVVREVVAALQSRRALGGMDSTLAGPHRA